MFQIQREMCRGLTARNSESSNIIEIDIWNMLSCKNCSWILIVMTYTEMDVKKVAALARLEVADEDVPTYERELASIFEMIQKIQDIDTSNIEPMSHPKDIELRLRPDQVTEPDQRAELQQIAPATENGLYLVPKVLDWTNTFNSEQ